MPQHCNSTGFVDGKKRIGCTCEQPHPLCSFPFARHYAMTFQQQRTALKEQEEIHNLPVVDLTEAVPIDMAMATVLPVSAAAPAVCHTHPGHQWLPGQDVTPQHPHGALGAGHVASYGRCSTPTSRPSCSSPPCRSHPPHSACPCACAWHLALPFPPAPKIGQPLAVEHCCCSCHAHHTDALQPSMAHGRRSHHS
jgi:hypothetical protein